MNILFSLTAYPPAVGGAQLHMHYLARQLAERHHIQVVTQWDRQRTDWLLGTALVGPRQPRAYQVDGIDVQRIALAGEVRRRLTPWILVYYALQGPALEQIAEALAVEIAPLAAPADLIHNCRIGREGLSYASLKLARRLGVPFVLTPVHHPRWGGWLHRAYHSLYRQADAVIALTGAERQMLVQLGVDERRVSVTGMGPVLAGEHDGEGFRARYGLGDDPLVLFLGQKYAYKGVAALLDATRLVWQRFPEARFAFIGPRTSHSRRLFASRPEARILELDTVCLQEKTDALAACDLLCVPSSQESFGGVFTEAWSLGKPVIGGDLPAVRLVIDHGRDGYLTAQAPGPVAERVMHLLERPALRAEMGQRGMNKVRLRYNWTRLAEQTEQAYRQALES